MNALKKKVNLGGFLRRSTQSIKKATKNGSTATKNSLKKATHAPITVAKKFRGSKNKREIMDVDLSPIPLSGGKMVYQDKDGLGRILTVKVY